MAYKDRPPLTNDDGDVREMTDDDWVWFVRTEDFGDVVAVHQFLEKREVFLRDAEVVGLEREAFLPYEPSKPGFIERATAAIEKLANLRAHAAE
jgi:hypothetical protein